MKKIIMIILTTLTIASCTGLSSKQYFERGDYHNSIKTAIKEISNAKTIEEKQVIKNRINRIVSIYENNYINAIDDFSKSKASFDMFKIVKIFNSNEMLFDYNNVARRYNASSLLIEASKKAISYYNRNNQVDILENLAIKMRKEDLKNTQYSNIYQNFLIKISDIYYEKAREYEYKGDLKNAAYYYKKTSDNYEEFDKNYRNSYNRYLQINKEVELIKAKKYYNEGVLNYHSKDYDRAKDYLEAAYKIYKKYDDYNKVREINVYLENIDYKNKEKKAEEYFNSAIYEYEYRNYEKSKELFIKASDLYRTFNDTGKLRQINLYIETINSKLNQNQYLDNNLFDDFIIKYNEKKYNDFYDEDINNYMMELRKIRRDRISEDRRLKYDKYIKDMNIYINNHNQINDYNKSYNDALYYFNKANNSKIEESEYYYKKSYAFFEKSLNYNKNQNKAYEINNYLNLISDIINEYIPSYLKGKKHYQLYTHNSYNQEYNKMISERNLKHAYKYAYTNYQKDEINKILKYLQK